jgi:tetratricopeptide (TPR) repeat protein
MLKLTAHGGSTYAKKREYDKAIHDFNRAIEINTRYTKAYCLRGAVYFIKKQYDKAWEDVHKAQGLGYQIPIKFLRILREASAKKR